MRYDWTKGSTLVVPFGAEHQHFNTGDTTARYFSAMSVHLEHFCGLHRHTQLEERGTITHLPNVPTSPNNFDVQGRRIVLPLAEAPVRIGGEAAEGSIPVIEPGKPLVLGTLDGMEAIGTAHKAKLVKFMRIGKGRNGFQSLETEISGILSDPPHEFGGTHAHMEAHLYVIQGVGHSVVDGESIPWKAARRSTCRVRRRCISTSTTATTESAMLRVAFGIRYFFENIAKEEFPYLYLAYRQNAMERPRERERERERTR